MTRQFLNTVIGPPPWKVGELNAVAMDSRGYIYWKIADDEWEKQGLATAEEIGPLSNIELLTYYGGQPDFRLGKEGDYAINPEGKLFRRSGGEWRLDRDFTRHG